MTPQELATKLNGREYRSEISRAEAADAKAAGLVVVFGASDDLTIFAGAIDDEGGFAAIMLDSRGLLPDRESCETDEEIADYLARKRAGPSTIFAEFGRNGWTYSTAIPHATFDVLEDDDLYCIGIVFSISDLGGDPVHKVVDEAGSPP